MSVMQRLAAGSGGKKKKAPSGPLAAGATDSASPPATCWDLLVFALPTGSRSRLQRRPTTESCLLSMRI